MSNTRKESKRFSLIKPTRCSWQRCHVVVHRSHARCCFGGNTNSLSFRVGFYVTPQIDYPTVDGRIEWHRVRHVCPALLAQMRQKVFTDLGIGQRNIQFAAASRYRLHEVRAANDSDELLLADNGQTLDSVFLKHFRNFMQWRIWRCGNNLPSHDIVGPVGMCFDILRNQSFIPRHQN